jgi:thioredoxin reductase (NADPH)
MCDHLQRLERGRAAPVHPSSLGCRECLESGDEWVHLRLCLTCGHVGCCDDSTNRHATRHARATRHPVIKSFEPGEDWAWCYVDEEMVDAISAFPEESPDRHYTPPEARP